MTFNRHEASKLIRSWMDEGNADEQAQTLRTVLAALDEPSSHLTLNRYQRMAARTIPHVWNANDIIHHALFGMTGELGELSDIFKKAWFQGHPLAYSAVQEELGDLLWHVAELATACGWTLEDVADANIAKLRKRYPGNGFSREDSIARVDVAGGNHDQR